MRIRNNGGLIGNFVPSTSTSTGVNRSAGEAAILNTAGQWPNSTSAIAGSVPIITNIIVTDASYNNTDDLAITTAGAYIKIIGTGFAPNAVVYINGVLASSTYVNATEIRSIIVSGGTVGGTASIMVFNGAAGAIYLTGVSYSNAPSWVTGAGSLATVYETTAVNNTVQATGDAPITYYIDSGNLPAGVTLNSITGVLSGTSTATSSNTTYTFTIRATDAQNQDSYRTFSLTINTDSFTWTSPATDGATYTLTQNTAMANVTLSASAGSGSAVTYTANALPTGVSLSGGVISGTPTTIGTSSTLVTATATTTTRTGTRTINWSITLAVDSYWNFNTLLLSANASIQTSSFVADNSINNAQLTVVGDTRAQNSNPYQPGYYSFQFNGSTDYLTVSRTGGWLPSGGNFTIEYWAYLTAYSSFYVSVYNSCPFGTSGASNGWEQGFGGTASSYTSYGFTFKGIGSVSATYNFNLNTWYHIAVVKNGTTTTIYINGVSSASTTTFSTWTDNAAMNIGQLGVSSYNFWFPGYLSNARIVSGVAMYNANFTPSTTPLTAVPGTILLTAQSNRFIDNSPSAGALTITSAPKISTATPFTTVYQAGTQYYSGYFNGSTDYLSLPANTAIMGTGDFTVECWAYHTSAAASVGYYYQGVGGSGGGIIFKKNASDQLMLSQDSVADIVTSSSTVPINQWVHVAASRSSGTVRIFINGVVVGTATYATSFTGATGNQTIGSVGPASYLSGYISNLRITKGQALYTTTFTPSTSPLTTTSQSATATNVAVLTCQSSTFVDNSTNAFVITSAGSAKPLPLSPFVPAYYSNYFNGSTDYLSAGVSVPITTGPFTIEAWVYCTSFGNSPSIVENSHWDIGQNAGYTLAFNTSGQLVLGASTGTYNTFPAVMTATSAVSLNRWTHIAVTRDSSNNVNMYYNGVSAGTPVSYSASLDLYSTTGAIFRVGVHIADGGLYQQWPGYISNVRVTRNQCLYTAAFTPPTSPLTTTSQGAVAANIAALTCQSIMFVDGSTTPLTLTQVGTPKIVAIAPFTQPSAFSSNAVTTYGSGYFDGTGDYLTIPSSVGLTIGQNTATVEFWIYPTSVSGFQRLVTTTNGAFNNGSFVIRFNNGTFLAGSGATNIVSSTLPVINQWNHVAWVGVSGTSQTLYINGINAGTTTTYNITEAITLIGGYYTLGPAEYAIGYMSDVRVVKGTALYTANFQPQFTGPLTAVTNTQLLTLQTRGPHNTTAAFYDNSSFNNLVTRFGDTNNGTFSPYGNNYSVYFNGTSDYLVLGSATQVTSQNFTMELWFNIGALTYLNSSSTYTARLISGGGTGLIEWSLSTVNSSTTTATVITVGTYGIATISFQVTGLTIPQNIWNHLALSRNGSSWAMWLNGTRIGTYTNASAFTGGQLYFGYGPGAGYLGYFPGYVSNIRYISGAVVYDPGMSTITVPTSPLLAIPNTALLTAQSNRFFDNSANALSITTGGAPSVQKFSPFSTVTVPTYYSTYFGTRTDYISLPVATPISTFTGDFTFEAWIYPTDTTVVNWGIWDSRQSGQTANAMIFTVGQLASPVTGQGRLMYYNGAYNYGTGIVYYNTWSHVAIVRIGSTMTFYINGAAGGTATVSGTQTANATTNPIYIGTKDTGVSGAYGTIGYISNFRIVNGTGVYTTGFTPPVAPLTAIPNTVLLTCQSGTVIDNSTNYYTLTSGSTTVKPLTYSPPFISAYYSYYLSAADTSQYLSVNFSANSNIAGDFTWECWAYDQLTRGYATLLGWRNGSSGWSGFLMQRNNGANNITLNINNGSATITQTSGTYTGNAWHHVALTRAGTTVTMWVDGLSVGTATVSGAFNPGSAYWIGSDPYNNVLTVMFGGYLSNIRFVNGTALYTSTFTPSTTPLTAVTNTQLLTAQSAYFVDNSTNYFAITRNGSPTIAAMAPFTQPSYATGPVSYTPALFSGSMYFDGTGDYLTIPYSSYYDIPASTAVTFECWVYTTSSNAFVMANRNWAFGTSGPTWGFSLNNGITPQWSIAGTGSATYVMAVSATSGTLGMWNHYAFTRDTAGVVRIFVNGVVGVSRTDTQAMTSASGAIYVGNPSGGTASYATGYMSDMRFILGAALYTSNFVPGAAPATPTYTIGTNTYSSTLLLNGTAGGVVDASRTVDLETVGDAKVTPFSPYNGTYYSNYFGGSANYLRVSTTAVATFGFGTGDFTIEGWFYGTTDNSTDFMIDFRGGVATAPAIFVYTSNQLAFFYNGSVVYQPASLTFTFGTWNHVALVRSSGMTKFYLNGTGAATTYTDTNNYPSAACIIGTDALAGGSSYWTGYMSNIRIVKGQALYTSNFTPSTSPLTTTSQGITTGTVSLLTCQSNKFVDNSSNAFAITTTGTPQVATQNPFQTNTGIGYYFDGTGDYLITPSNPTLKFGTGDFTIEFWWYPSTLATAQELYFHSNDNAVTGTGEFVIVYNTSLGLRFYINVGATVIQQGATTGWTVGQWYHVAAVRSSGTLTLYRNGVSIASGSASGVVIGADIPTYIGGEPYGPLYDNCYITDLRVTNGYARYTAAFTPPTAPLPAN